LIDTYNSWAAGTLAVYRPLLNYLHEFEEWSGVKTLKATVLIRPPVDCSISLQWAQLSYSVKPRAQGGGQGVAYGTARGVRSAASYYYIWDLSQCFPDRAVRDQRRGKLVAHVMPTDALSYSLFSAGMSRRMGDRSISSWALSHVHISYIDKNLDRAYLEAKTAAGKHDFACAGAVNLFAYMGWLRGGEVFALEEEDLTVIPPRDGAIYGLAHQMGAILANLLPETKTDKTCVADIVIAFETLSGLSLGKWFQRVQALSTTTSTKVFATTNHPRWSSRLFRKRFAVPILDQMRRSGEPTLQIFSDEPGHRICDAVFSMHSWRRAGRSHVERAPRPHVRKRRFARKASPTEVDEHGRWRTRRQPGQHVSMPILYNQWELIDRIAITYFCM
jgi:hypothetical protein